MSNHVGTSGAIYRRRTLVAFVVSTSVALLFSVLKKNSETTNDGETQRAVAAVKAVRALNDAARMTSESSDAEFTRFKTWTERYQNSNTSAQAMLVEEGVELARQRRAALKSLIQTDPQAALAQAAQPELYKVLPIEIVDLLEEKITGTANYYLDCVLPAPGQSQEKAFARSFTHNGNEYRAHVFGRMLHQTTQKAMPVQGISIDNEAALQDDPYFHGLAWGDSSAGSSIVDNRPLSNWTHGAKKVLMMRVDFPDLPGEPVLAGTNILITTNYGASVFNIADGIRDFFQASSYSNTDLLISAADVTPVYRMPSNAVYYAQGDGQSPYSGKLRDTALAMAASSYNLDQYDRIGLVCSFLGNLPNSRMTFGGVANVGGENFLINGYYSFDVLTHEIGHTYGFFHADWWNPTNKTTIGEEQDMLWDFYNGAIYRVTTEYGDRFDSMGGQPGPVDMRNQFNHWFRNLAGWMPDSAVQTVNTSGTYRVYRFDDAAVDATNHKLALKICRDIRRNYWVGYRRQFTSGCNLANGAYILFGYNFNYESELLVCNNPGTNVDNAALMVGQTLIDTNAGVSIKTLAQGGTAPHEYLDIQVTLQPRVSFATNYVEFETTSTNAAVVVDRLGGSSGVTTVNYACVNSSATNGIHYAAASGTLTWSDGDNTPRTINIPMLNFDPTNGARNFTVVLNNVTNGVLINPSTVTVSLRPPGNISLLYGPDRISGTVEAMALQPDGKIVVGGSIYGVGQTGGRDYIAGLYCRLNADGTRDYSFKCNPGATDPLAHVESIKVQPDGKILISGGFTNVDNANPPIGRIARLNSDGTRDITFSPPVFDQSVHDMAVQPDGKIVCVGDFRSVGGQPCQLICRLQPNGAIDFLFNPGNYFGDGGMYKVALENYGNSNANEVKIVAVGSLRRYFSGNGSYGVIRLKSDGSVDSTFDMGGAGANSWVRSMTLQPDGKIVIGGDFTTINGLSYQHLARLNYNGSLDTSFNPTVTGSYPLIFNLFAQPDGKLLFGGQFTGVNGVTQKNLMRLAANGSNDGTWDNGTGTSNGTAATIYAFALRPDGRLLVSGTGHGFRGYTGPPFQGYISTTPFYSGITNGYGIAQLANGNYTILPGTSINIPVLRLNGSSGQVKLDYGLQSESAVPGTDFTPAQGTIVWGDGDSLVKTVTITCPPTATAGRVFKVNLAIPRDGIQIGSVPMAQIIITTNYSYELWKTQKFTVSQQTDDNISGIFATPANDSVKNLMKYAFDLDPFGVSSASTNLPQFYFVGDRLRAIFNRHPLKTDLTYEVQSSQDLASWSAVARSVAGGATTNVNAFTVSETPNNSLFKVTVDDIAAATTNGERFIRLQISKP